jgi:peptidoglycan/LPS O-acetylase OafA/YrhL
MPMAHVYPAFVMIGLLMLAGAVIARRWRFYGQMIAPSSRARFESLDGLRGFLALAVMIHHGMSMYMRITIDRWTVGDHPTFQLFGTAAVALFFMITGFLFWGKILADDGRLHIRNHIRGRLMRLAPVYLFIATVATAITVLSLWPLRTGYSRLGSMFFTIYAMGILPWHTMHGFDPGRIVAGVTWTLRYEWLFYGVLPLLVYFRKTRWIVAMSVGYLVYFVSTTHGWIHRPLGPAVNLLGGMIAAQLHYGGAFSRIAWRSKWMSLVAIALLIAMPYSMSYRFPILLFPITLAIFFIVIRGNTFFGILTASGPKTVGVMSYSVYLLHGIVLYLGQPLLKRMANFHSATLYWIALTGLGLIAVAISAITYRWIEHPFIEMERARRKAAAPAGKIAPAYAQPARVATPTRLAA